MRWLLFDVGLHRPHFLVVDCGGGVCCLFPASFAAGGAAGGGEKTNKRGRDERLSCC